MDGLNPSSTTKRNVENMGNKNEENRDFWHIMTLEEKKREARKAGLRISDWEAMQNMEIALNESKLSGLSKKMSFAKHHSFRSMKDEPKEERKHDPTDSESEEEEVNPLIPFFDDFGADDENEENQGDVISDLPSCVQFHICQFLESEDVCKCSIVSPHWHFARDEEIFKMFCYKTYLTQGKKKILNPKRWRGWRNMFIWRPRVRTNGFYMLRKGHVRKPQLDMWTEVKRGEIVETVYYRYFWFDATGPGEVLYSLLHCGPDEVLPLLNPKNENTYIGTYSVHKKQVHIDVETTYAFVSFDLEIEKGWGGGHFSKLVLKGHHSSAASLGPNARMIPHETNDECFYFYRQNPKSW
eukprot:CAMPEP_0117743128 /NCGR_PEP_ID=MMETSP0947-20121206/5944_1 /TAXON_ID=44440 /ORGANISM="Chattonella subsalsa, Strain CCMP2191" /LENGTH=353 /DNA_ID=CAMNT_0005559757 /DNA_START=117 /DNA_END=1175 /DNA_ORIENTATION=-